MTLRCRPLETMVVVPPSSGLPADLAEYQNLAGGGPHIVSVVPDRSEADARLADGSLDVVVGRPDNPSADFEEGEQSVFEVVINVVDPIQVNYAGFLANNLTNAVNREIIRQAAELGEGMVADAGIGTGETPLSVIAAPTRAELRNVAPVTPGWWPSTGLPSWRSSCSTSRSPSWHSHSSASERPGSWTCTGWPQSMRGRSDDPDVAVRHASPDRRGDAAVRLARHASRHGSRVAPRAVLRRLLDERTTGREGSPSPGRDRAP